MPSLNSAPGASCEEDDCCQQKTFAVVRVSSEPTPVLRQWIIGRSSNRPSMGAFLDKPKTDKSNSRGEGLGVRYAVAAMQGWRVDMEDAHVVKLGLDDEPPFKDWAFFGVFDGHAGMKVAQHSSEHLLQSVLTTEQFKILIEETKKSGGKLSPKLIKLLEEGVKDGFLTLDSQMKDRPDIHGENERSGTTATCALLTPTHIFLANLGDSRAVLSKQGAAAFGTEDHKPFLPKERDRIVNAGGSVMIQRVNGSLAVSRALGDFEYKSVPGLQATQQLVSPEPDVYVLERSGDRDEFLLLACDGVYDVMSNTELCDFVRSRMKVTDDLAAVSNQVLDACLSKGSRDNMSVVLVAFPGCPKVDPEAQKADAEWKKLLETKVTAIVAEEEANPDEDDMELDVDSVMRSLMHVDIPGLPAGAGIHAARSDVDAILERIKKEKGTASKNNSTR
uniref:PPM-type phosphatase domain-containing protein n=1 Tax=Plectus sambesii TaxID=2011161 RepID=A0A914WF50_9BILA